MEANQNGLGETSENSSAENQDKNTVAYSTYSKAIGEIKSLKSKLNDFMSKEQEREQSILSEQGKFKELNQSLSSKLKDSETKLEQMQKTFAKSIFSKEAKNIAMQMGAMPEALEDLVKTGDWSEVEIDEQFNINENQLKEAIGKIQKSKPYFFKKDVKRVQDVNINNGASGKLDLNSMSKEDIIKLLKET